MATSTEDLDFGGRVQFFRNRVGLSQKQFGELCGRSESWAWRIENEGRLVDSVTLLRTMVSVLNLRNIAQLVPDVYMPLASDEGPEHGSALAFRKALHLPASVQSADPLELSVLSNEVAEAWKIYNEATIRYEILGPLLPKLLAQAYQTIRNVSESQRTDAVRETVSVLNLSQIYLRRVGSLPLAEIAADRALTLADETGDAALISAAAWNVCCVLTSSGHVEESRDLALSMIDRYAPTADSRVEHRSAQGALHLQAAVASMRANHGPAAWDLWHGAERIASQLPSDGDDQWHTSFCASNVLMHRVHLHAEEGAHDEALRFADNVADNESLPLERRTRYFIELMHSLRVTKDLLGALFIAQKIQKLSPEEFRWHPLARSTVAHLVKNERPSYRVEVRALAEQIGMRI